MGRGLAKKSLRIKVSKSIGDVSALFYLPSKAEQALVFAHGAGAGMKNKFMEQAALMLTEQGIATLRFNFPYMEKGKKVPDPKPVCFAAISTAVDKASALCPKLPLFAGGKSFGGRMTSTVASEGMIENMKGIIFFGFPLHAPGKPSNERAEHLYKVNIPMLFLQGTRDSLASLDLLKPVIKKLGKKAELFIIEGADHSFHVPKDNKITDSEVIELICKEIKRWMEALISQSAF
ncbi:MAG: dienelactone hydrolase family protein [Chlorobi bacterium]|nr:dienelactone hydrolase family protein [Chlorobiota bacterium]MCI0715498.1 dienelactone hydrolase family protein [Chlorobiota bacterium]